MNFLMVFIGGGLGSVMRYLISLGLQKYTFLPFGTLSANAIGGFLMGVCLCIFVEKGLLLQWRLFFMVGFLGGFTTFSSFGGEVFTLIKSAEYQRAVLYILSSNVIVIALVTCGFILSKKILFQE